MERLGFFLAVGGIAYYIYQGTKKNAEILVENKEASYTARVVDPSNELRNPSHMQYGRNLTVKALRRGQFGSPMTVYENEDGTEINAYGLPGQNSFTRTTS